MNLTYEKKEAMTFIGYHTEIKPEEGYVKCPEFWDKAYNERYARLWQTMKLETPVEKAILANRIGMFAICAESENGFAYWIAGLYRGGNVPEGLELYTFPESNWAIFTTKGACLKSFVIIVSSNIDSFIWCCTTLPHRLKLCIMRLSTILLFRLISELSDLCHASLIAF